MPTLKWMSSGGSEDDNPGSAQDEGCYLEIGI